jgi:hypothetical protein
VHVLTLRITGVVVTWLSLASLSFAQITAIGPFQGAAQEGFESLSSPTFETCVPQRVFNSRGDLCSLLGGIVVTTSWSFFCKVDPIEGEFLAGSTGSSAVLTFDEPVRRFGGYFAKNVGTPDATAEIYGVDGVLLATSVMTIPDDCTWAWSGWDSFGGPPIGRVLFTSNAFGGGFVMMDALEADFCPAPLAYCAGKPNSLGCVPAIGAVGWPSASRASGFTLHGRPFLNNRLGLLCYGIDGPLALPFAGGTLCVSPPLHRTPTQNSKGTLTGNDCSGVFALDMNSFAAGTLGGRPIAELSQIGTSVYCQYFARDPGFAAPENVSLSNGLQYFICP